MISSNTQFYNISHVQLLKNESVVMTIKHLHLQCFVDIDDEKNVFP